MKTSTLQSGFSLLDLIIGIIFLSIAFVGSMVTIRNLQSQQNEMEAMVRGSSMASNIIEVMRSYDFDENAVSPWSSPLGPEEGQIEDYDDVDDYMGASWSYNGYTGFSGNSRVFYVDPTINLMDSTGTVTDYKRLIVTVTHAEMSTPVILSSIKTP